MNPHGFFILKIMSKTKHICLLSGGHDSAKVSLNVVARYGKENVILLNHNINNKKENADIKRFKMEISAYLGIPLTYANIDGILDDGLIPNQFDICIEKGAVTEGNGNALCTYYLKTKPFMDYLNVNFADKNCIIYYGFSKKEKKRIVRRTTHLGAFGYKTDYPLALWEAGLLPYHSSLQVGITPPNTYTTWLHANCIGCLKAGLLHWYCVYMLDIDAYHEAMVMEYECDFTIHEITIKGIRKPILLKDLMPIFCQLKTWGVKPNEHQNKYKFGRWLSKIGVAETQLFKPCECVI